MTEFEPIPDFLNIKLNRQRWEEGRRKIAAHVRQYMPKFKRDFALPKTLSIEAKAMIKSQRKEKAQKLRNLRKKRRKG